MCVIPLHGGGPLDPAFSSAEPQNPLNLVPFASSVLHQPSSSSHHHAPSLIPSTEAHSTTHQPPTWRLPRSTTQRAHVAPRRRRTRTQKSGSARQAASLLAPAPDDDATAEAPNKRNHFAIFPHPPWRGRCAEGVLCTRGLCSNMLPLCLRLWRTRSPVLVSLCIPHS